MSGLGDDDIVDCGVCECLMCAVEDKLWERHVRDALGQLGLREDDLFLFVGVRHDWIRALRRRPSGRPSGRTRKGPLGDKD